jgi:hypothetical protein
MDDKEMEARLARLAGELKRLQAERAKSSEQSQRDTDRRREIFAALKTGVLIPAVEHFRDMLAHQGIASTTERDAPLPDSVKLTIGVHHLTLTTRADYSEIICTTNILRSVPGHHPKAVEAWPLETVTPETIKTAIFAFIEEALKPA